MKEVVLITLLGFAACVAADNVSDADKFKLQVSPAAVSGTVEAPAITKPANFNIVPTAQVDRKAYCGKMEEFSKNFVSVGLDTFAITQGKESKCEDHSPEEWNELMGSREMGIMIGLNYSLPSCEYKEALAEIKNAKVKTGDEMKVVLQSKLDSIVASCDYQKTTLLQK